MDKCLLCKKDINKDDPNTWKQVLGWVGGPRKDSMRLRSNTGGLAHDVCVEKMQRGQAVDQPDIWEMDTTTHVQGTDDVEALEGLLDDREV